MIRIICQDCGGRGYTGNATADPELNDADHCDDCDGEGFIEVTELGPDDEEFVVTGVGTMTLSMDDLAAVPVRHLRLLPDLPDETDEDPF